MGRNYVVFSMVLDKPAMTLTLGVETWFKVAPLPLPKGTIWSKYSMN